MSIECPDCHERVAALPIHKCRQANVYKCRCNYHLGMGPNLQCPVHGTRENLFIGTRKLHDEVERLKAEVRELKEFIDDES